MAAQKTEYTELSRAKISATRNAVISKCSRGGFTVAQQISVDENDGSQTMSVFLKGALHVDSVESLESFRDALTVAINDAKEWD